MILAMGAEHIEQDKLRHIIDQMHDEMMNPYPTKVINIDDRIKSTYGDGIEVLYGYARMPYIAEEKKDGYSYLADHGRFLSKSLSTARGNEGAPIDKSESVPHLVRVFKLVCGYLDIDIHGELYVPGGTSDDVTRIMGCASDKAVQRQLEYGWLRYMIHDIRKFAGHVCIDEPWYIRRSLLEYVYKNYIVGTEFAQYVDISSVFLEPIQAFKTIVRAGGEGLVIKRTNALYVPDKKPTDNWIKCKKEITLDVVIIGFNNDGSGKNAGLFKSIQVGLWNGDGIRYVGNIHSGISDELRRKMHEDRDGYIGRVIEVDAMEYNKKSWSLRHGRFVRFRDDKLPTECTTNGIRIKEEIL